MNSSRTSRWLGAVALSAGLAAAPAVGDVQYSYDDGTMDSAVGPPSSFPVNP